VSFAEIQHEIKINEDEVEEFLIDVIKTNLVRAKIAQEGNVVHVSSTMHRTFGPGDWQQLHQLLTQVRHFPSPSPHPLPSPVEEQHSHGEGTDAARRLGAGRPDAQEDLNPRGPRSS
jgi:hypothetical protein